MNLRPPGPERAPDESHSVSSGGIASQEPEITGDAELAASDGVAESGCVETPFGAPVVRRIGPDPGPHERLLTVREAETRALEAAGLLWSHGPSAQLFAAMIGAGRDRARRNRSPTTNTSLRSDHLLWMGVPRVCSAACGDALWAKARRSDVFMRTR